MAEQIECPYCHRTGFVRREHVISKATFSQQLYCGACDRTWQELTEAPPPPAVEGAKGKRRPPRK